MSNNNLKSLILSLSLVLITNLCAQEKPNILWIYAEDTSPWMGCYGDAINSTATPNIDSIAKSGVLFKRAYVPAPVCSATRSAMIVGQNAIRFGGHEHRSSRAGTKLYLPENYKLLPELMQEKGYKTFNHGKGDYNFVWDSKKVYNINLKSKTNLKELIAKQPFFGQIQTKGGKNNTSKFPAHRKVSPKNVTVPADYPNNQIFKEVVAQHYDAIRMDDDLIGKILQSLKDTGLDKNTIVVYFSDHGANNLLRHKQMTTEGGLHVPFMIMGPEKYVPQKQTRNELVNMLDLCATTLAWANIEQPTWYEGQNLFAHNFSPRSFVAAHKDRLDHTIDRVRTLRTEKFRYVKNFMLDRIFLQPQYRDKKNFTQNLHELYQSGQLSEKHKQIYFGERQAEELYDLTKDPEMMHNLVNDPAFSTELEHHRSLLQSWLSKGDMGSGKESIATLKANGENQKWGEGQNLEYEEYRVDSDGDGLSDKWEKLNNRKPDDGLLYFDFNCGAWQTEGWSSRDINSNLAGFLGFLDFELNIPAGTISRSGLNLKASPQDKNLLIRIRSNQNLELSTMTNQQELGFSKLEGDDKFHTIKIPLKNSNWKGLINSLSLTFKAKPNSKIEIDSIKIER